MTSGHHTFQRKVRLWLKKSDRFTLCGIRDLLFTLGIHIFSFFPRNAFNRILLILIRLGNSFSFRYKILSIIELRMKKIGKGRWQFAVLNHILTSDCRVNIGKT